MIRKTGMLFIPKTPKDIKISPKFCLWQTLTYMYIRMCCWNLLLLL